MKKKRSYNEIQNFRNPQKTIQHFKLTGPTTEIFVCKIYTSSFRKVGLYFRGSLAVSHCLSDMN